MAKIDDILHLFKQLKADRATWESHWEEIADRVLPRQNDFVSEGTPGEKKTHKIFDSTPQIALERFSAVMDSMLTPRQQIWHNLKASDENLNKVFEVKEWFYEANKILWAVRYSPKANYASQNFERWISVGAFGTGDLFTDFEPGLGMRYRVIHLKNLFFLQNHQGIIDTVFRTFNYTPRQAIQKWGEKNLPEKILKASENPNQQNKKFPFLHVVMPRNDYDPDRLDARGMPWASIYVCLTSNELINEGGYRSWPHSISRYVTAPEEVYGRSPAMTALADIKMLNEMSKTDIRAVHKLVNPPLLLGDDGVLGGGARTIDLRPGAVNMGGVNREGRQLVHPLQTGARVDIAEDKMEGRRKRIEDAFLVTLFQILVENPRMTATEALIRAQEKGMLLAPTMGRQQSEAIGPQIEREIDILMQNGILPPLPEALIEAGGEYEIIYDSPMSRMQRAEELVGVQRSMELLAPFAQMRPEVLDIFDDDKLARLTAEVSGVPMPVLRSKDEVINIRKQRQQAAEAQQIVEAAQPVAGALKDAAQAQAISQGR